MTNSQKEGSPAAYALTTEEPAAPVQDPAPDKATADPADAPRKRKLDDPQKNQIKPSDESERGEPGSPTDRVIPRSSAPAEAGGEPEETVTVDHVAVVAASAGGVDAPEPQRKRQKSGGSVEPGQENVSEIQAVGSPSPDDTSKTVQADSGQPSQERASTPPTSAQTDVQGERSAAPGASFPIGPNGEQSADVLARVSDKGLQEILEPLAHIGHDIWTVMYKVTNSLRSDTNVHWGNLLSQDSSQPSVQLRGAAFSVGRNNRSDLQLRDPSISVNVFRLVAPNANASRVIIESQSNSSRVNVNGVHLPKRVPMFVKSGDEISVTSSTTVYSFILQLLPSRESVPPPPVQPAPTNPRTVASSPPSVSPNQQDSFVSPVPRQTRAHSSKGGRPDPVPASLPNMGPLPSIPCLDSKAVDEETIPSVPMARGGDRNLPRQTLPSLKQVVPGAVSQPKQVRFASKDTVFNIPSSPTSSRQMSGEATNYYKKLGREFFENNLSPPEKLDASFDNFPYSYLSDDLKNLLISSSLTFLTNPDVAALTSHLESVSRRILLSGPHATEMYQEKLIRSLASHFRANLFVIDTTALQHLGDPAILDGKGEANQELDKATSTSASDSVSPKSTDEPAEPRPDVHEDGVAGQTATAPDVQMTDVCETTSTLHERKEPGTQETTPKPEEEKTPEPAKPSSKEQKSFSSSRSADFKTGDRVRYIGDSSRVDRFNVRQNVRRVISLPPPLLPSPSAMPNEESHDRSYGDKLFRRQFLGRRPDPRPDAHPGPAMGNKGKVVITFEGSKRVGVRFDKPVSGGHNLGNQCEDGHGYFCTSRELALDEDQSPSAQSTIFDAIVEAAKDEKNQPLIVFLKDSDRRIYEGHEHYWSFRNALNKLDGRCLVVGSVVARPRAGSALTGPQGQGGMGSVMLKTGHPPGVFGDPSSPHHAAVLDMSLLDQLTRAEERMDNASKSSRALRKLFPVRLSIVPPTDPDKLSRWEKELERDLKRLKLDANVASLEKILASCKMQAEDLRNVKELSEEIFDVESFERMICFAVSARLVELEEKGERPQESDGSTRNFILTKTAINHGFRLVSALKTEPADSSVNKSLRDVKTENDFEKKLLAEVVPPREIGVKFGDIGALDRCKEALQEVVMLPLKRPELFRRGNLTKPCKGVLLFGPPGTGKTMLAKAVATEAGANFINLSMSSVASKWFGEAEKYVRAVFTLARKIAPSVIFIDEVDSMLGKRDKHGEHEAMRKLKNEFMSSWDGLRTTDSERILVLAATNRPFDIDEAVLRRLPRRLMVDLPDVENRTNILKVILEAEELDSSVNLAALAEELEGYSGSDLRNLSVAAAYKPVREVLADEKKLNGVDTNDDCERDPPEMRALRQSDFLEAKEEVSCSVSEDAYSIGELRKWNETYGEGGSRKKGGLTYFL